MYNENLKDEQPSVNHRVRNLFGSIVDFISNIDSPVKHTKVPVERLSKSRCSEYSDYGNVATEQKQTRRINDSSAFHSSNNVIVS